VTSNFYLCHPTARGKGFRGRTRSGKSQRIAERALVCSANTIVVASRICVHRLHH
jgi:hypothetical protein